MIKDNLSARKSVFTHWLIVLENTSKQLLSDGVVAESEVDDVDIGGWGVELEPGTSQLCRQVETKPVSRFDLSVADLDLPLASLHPDQFGKAQNRRVKRFVDVLNKQRPSSRRCILQVAAKLLDVCASHLTAQTITTTNKDVGAECRHDMRPSG